MNSNTSIHELELKQRPLHNLVYSMELGIDTALYKLYYYYYYYYIIIIR